MANGSRLDRIEALVKANALAFEADHIQLRSKLHETRAKLAQIAENSARESAEMKRRHEEFKQRFETMLADMRGDRAYLYNS